MNQPQITPELIASHGLKPDEYQRILKLIGRVPSFTDVRQAASDLHIGDGSDLRPETLI